MKDKTILEVFEEERAALVPWQGPYDGYAETTAAVSRGSARSGRKHATGVFPGRPSPCLVSFDREEDQETPRWGVSPTQGYSVSAEAVGRPVQVRAFADRIVMLQDGRAVGEHARVFGRDQTVYDPWRHVPVLERKPGAARATARPSSAWRCRRRWRGFRGGSPG